MSGKVIVKFTKPWRGYSPGDVAGFEESVAESLVGAGVATGYSSGSAAATLSSPLSERRPKAADKKPASRAGASKAPVVEPQTPAVDPLSLELPSGSLDPAGASGGGELTEGGESEAGDPVTGTGAEGEGGSAEDEGDNDEGKP